MANEYKVIGGNATPVYVVNGETPGGVSPATEATLQAIKADIEAGVELVAGEAHIGSVGGNSVNVDCIPTLSVHATYISGDYVGESGASFEVPDCARVDGGSGFIVSALLIDKAKQSVAGELWLFDAPVTPPADSAPWSLSDADMEHCFAIIPFSTYYASALNSVSQSDGGRYMFKCTPASREIYFCFVTRGAPAYASGDLFFRFFISQDI